MNAKENNKKDTGKGNDSPEIIEVSSPFSEYDLCQRLTCRKCGNFAHDYRIRTTEAGPERIVDLWETTCIDPFCDTKRYVKFSVPVDIYDAFLNLDEDFYSLRYLKKYSQPSKTFYMVIIGIEIACFLYVIILNYLF
jgi:hypothetical protein